MKYFYFLIFLLSIFSCKNESDINSKLELIGKEYIEYKFNQMIPTHEKDSIIIDTIKVIKYQNLNDSTQIKLLNNILQSKINESNSLINIKKVGRDKLKINYSESEKNEIEYEINEYLDSIKTYNSILSNLKNNKRTRNDKYLYGYLVDFYYKASTKFNGSHSDSITLIINDEFKIVPQKEFIEYLFNKYK